MDRNSPNSFIRCGVFQDFSCCKRNTFKMAHETRRWRKEAFDLTCEGLSTRAIAKKWRCDHGRWIASHTTIHRWLKASKGASTTENKSENVACKF